MPLVERELISRIRRLAAKRPGRSHARERGGVIAGIGDDCAVLRVPVGHELLVTTDFSVEGIHFRRDWHSPQVIGHRCLTRGLSDIAAMGGDPVAAFLSLALPARTPQRWVDGFLQGLLKLAKDFDVPLAGGDTTRSPGEISADIVVLGSVPKGDAILRSGARLGDRIYVTGAPGAAAAETTFLFAKGKVSGIRAPVPYPRIDIGRTLRELRAATAMIDISDGLSTDLSHICNESGVGARIRSDAIPRGKFRGRAVDLHFALHGGDAYELLFTAPKRMRPPSEIHGIPISEIGEITKERKLILVDPNERPSLLRPQGWEHFRPSSPGSTPR